MTDLLPRTLHKLRTGQPATIVGLGDSLTSGWCVAKGYLDFLEEMLQHAFPHAILTVVNAGVPGDTARGGLHRLECDARINDPDLVLVQFALNDAFCGCTPEEFSRDLAAIVARIRDRAEALLLTSTLPGSVHDRLCADTFYTCVEKVGQAAAVPVARVDRHWRARIAAGTIHPDLLQDDQVHPTEAGHILMAEAVMQILTPGR